MDRLIILMFILFGVGILYGYILRKFTNNKWILYLPTYLGAIGVLYLVIFYQPTGEGFQDLAKFLMILIFIPIILGNFLWNIIINR